jgi:hypothetical protein
MAGRLCYWAAERDDLGREVGKGGFCEMISTAASARVKERERKSFLSDEVKNNPRRRAAESESALA